MLVERPPQNIPPTPPGLAPLRGVAGLAPGPSSKPFMAQSWYIYTFEGVDQDCEAAELMTAMDGSIEGWTWRFRDVSTIDKD